MLERLLSGWLAGWLAGGHRRGARSIALAALALALALPARAQDDPPPPPPEDEEDPPPAPAAPTEQMLRTCPDLRAATGRAREQLIALFFGLDPRALDDESSATTRALFDLGEPDDVALLARYLDAPGPCRCIDGLKAVIVAHGADGLAWTLERLAAAPPPRKGRLVALLGAVHAREGWRALIALLGDTSSVPNPEQARVAPPGWEALRIADHAFVALGPRFADRPRPDGIAEWRIDPVMPMGVRDKRLEALRGLLAGDAELRERIASAPALADAEPAKAARLLAALRAVGAE